MRYELLSDEELINRCQAGESDAFEALYYRYRRPLIAYAYGMLHNHEDALDAFQETFKYLFRKIPDYVPEARFSTLAYKVMRNICIDIKRKRRVANAGDISEEIDAAGDHRLESDVERRDLAKAARAAVEEIPEVYREALKLRLEQGRSYEEIAEILGCPLGTVKSRIHTALELTRELMRKKELL